MRDQESREAAPSIDEATVDASMGDEPEGWSGRPAGRSRNRICIYGKTSCM